MKIPSRYSLYALTIQRDERWELNDESSLDSQYWRVSWIISGLAIYWIQRLREQRTSTTEWSMCCMRRTKKRILHPYIITRMRHLATTTLAHTHYSSESHLRTLHEFQCSSSVFNWLIICQDKVSSIGELFKINKKKIHEKQDIVLLRNAIMKIILFDLLDLVYGSVSSKISCLPRFILTILQNMLPLPSTRPQWYHLMFLKSSHKLELCCRSNFRCDTIVSPYFYSQLIRKQSPIDALLPRYDIASMATLCDFLVFNWLNKYPFEKWDHISYGAISTRFRILT